MKVMRLFFIASFISFSLYGQECSLPESSSLMGKPAPDFTAQAVIDGEIKDISLYQFKNKFKLLVFYPADFSMVCPTELRAFQEEKSEFDKRGAQILGISVDSVFAHKAWLEMPQEQAGISGIEYPLVSDITKKISCAYGVLDASGVAQRGIFILDATNKIQYISINNLGFGRNIKEIIRIIDAITFTEQNHGEVCPVNWEKGERAMEATPEGAKEYFAESASS